MTLNTRQILHQTTWAVQSLHPRAVVMQEQHSRFQRLIVSDTDKGVETAAEHADCCKLGSQLHFSGLGFVCDWELGTSLHHMLNQS